MTVAKTAILFKRIFTVGIIVSVYDHLAFKGISHFTGWSVAIIVIFVVYFLRSNTNFVK